jgi:glycosyltransferase involved in cell wall biosynthesis
MSDPLVSFIIPTFNRPTFLAATLESVLAQDYPAKEIIVVDDGSTDNMAEVCARFPVLYLRQENRGPSAAYNLGASRCRGELLVFLDDDDLCPPGSLRVRVEHWQRDPGCHHVVGRLRRFREERPGHIEFIDSEEQAANIICVGPEVMMRRAFEKVGGFDESLRMSEDVDLWLRMREAGFRQKFIPEICLFNRMHPGKLTAADQVETRNGFINALHMRMQRARQPRSAIQP